MKNLTNRPLKLYLDTSIPHLDEVRNWKKKVAAETNRMSKSKLVRYFNQAVILTKNQKAA